MEIIDKINLLFPPEMCDATIIEEELYHLVVLDDEDLPKKLPEDLKRDLQRPARGSFLWYITNGKSIKLQEQMQCRLPEQTLQNAYVYEYDGHIVCCHKTVWIHATPEYRSALARRQFMMECYVENLLKAIEQTKSYLDGAEIVHMSIFGSLPY